MKFEQLAPNWSYIIENNLVDEKKKEELETFKTCVIGECVKNTGVEIDEQGVPKCSTCSRIGIIILNTLSNDNMRFFKECIIPRLEQHFEEYHKSEVQ